MSNICCCLQQRNKASMRELEKGQKVICKHRNGRYYHCEVVELTKATFYEVIFDDGSFSDNLFPEDIVVRKELHSSKLCLMIKKSVLKPCWWFIFQNRDCRQLGPPSEGDVVQVLWTDGLIYGAKFVSDHIIPMYQVRGQQTRLCTLFGFEFKFRHCKVDASQYEDCLQCILRIIII